MRTQAHAILPGAVGAEFICGKFLSAPFRAGTHTSLPRVLHFLFLPGEPRQRAFLACDAMVTSFHFPGRPGKERSQRKGAAGQAKNKRAAHTVRPAPTPGPLILTLTFPIHFDDHIKRITRLRTFPIHSPASTPSGHNGKHPRMAPKGADTTFLKCTYTHFSRLASPCVRENVAFSPASAPPENLLSNTGAAPRPCRLRPVPAEREKNRLVASAGAPV